ncbi:MULTISPECIES: PilX N-terminal domain-containing pilus assembly protein [Pseudomonadaceae]|uniref:Type 4 fimbrial biogenesis protein PilX N-terminal domain-containing protein n=1 Tax=Pseudomonas denitrificans TaxID=43306 RepID=A0A9X7N180_PSEDE|nr:MULTISPECIES: PilX N-terminal domain-containing pilus assembly protein [Pseudomonadaceae]OQR37160.1 hypothetical protein BWR15_04005 [Pseudomonas sp. T]MBD9512992.1 hypothetical protein [Pseudomonas sp. PDM22]MBD9630501.1 hypothetical protein [Pseudomonas sp. PDM19]MBD9681217.1 hypothetical protein [Pseudomonas sp. PDM20]QEY73258.1 hypothetical protein F1C79_17535 [Pseudomonas denitrificans (nom. rej.)]
MTTQRNSRAQQGATLVVALVMLLMLMLMVGSAYTLSGTNLKAVGNMQFRNEAIAAADVGIQRVIGSAFTAAPAAEQLNVDINNDGTTDYQVSMASPVCMSARPSPSNLACGGGQAAMCSTGWDTVWGLNADVTDAVTGTSVRVRSGVRVHLTDSQKVAACGA